MQVVQSCPDRTVYIYDVCLLRGIGPHWAGRKQLVKKPGTGICREVMRICTLALLYCNFPKEWDLHDTFWWSSCPRWGDAHWSDFTLARVPTLPLLSLLSGNNLQGSSMWTCLMVTHQAGNAILLLDKLRNYLRHPLAGSPWCCRWLTLQGEDVE